MVRIKESMFTGEIIISILLILLLGLLLNPSMFFMPESFDMMLLVGIVVVFLTFSLVLWKEHALDERENLHRLNAGRLSFFAGSLVLIIGVILQALRHEIDPWLIYGLIAMIVGKIVSRIYSQLKH